MDQFEHCRRCVLCVKYFSHPKATRANTPVKPDHPKATCATTPVKPDHSKATCANTPVKSDHPKATCANNPVKLFDHVIVCSAATDGQLVLWDVTTVIQTWLDSVSGYSVRDDVCPPVPLCVIQCHQSGINDMDIKCVTGKKIYMENDL